MRPLAFALLVGGCAATPPPVEPEWEPAPITPSPPETWAKIGVSEPVDDSAPIGPEVVHPSNAVEKPEPMQASGHEPAENTPVQETARGEHVAWVRENCEPQSYPVTECETRCSGRNCEAECETFQAYASCPMVECPEGTDPNWIAEYYQASCGSRRAIEVKGNIGVFP